MIDLAGLPCIGLASMRRGVGLRRPAIESDSNPPSGTQVLFQIPANTQSTFTLSLVG